jgi:thioredoxin 1
MNIIAEEKLTMVDFYTTWCGPCKMMDPFVKEIKAENSDIVNVLQVDAEAQFDIASQYDIQGYPTVIFFKNGQLVHRAMGAMPKEELLNLVNKFK